MKIYSTIILLVLYISVCFSQAEYKSLKKAFRKNSKKELRLFFEKWEKEINPITDNQFLNLNDTVKEVYNIFSAFYKPLQIDSLGGSEWGTDIYKDVEFLIIQDEIKVYFSNKVFYTEEEVEKFVVDWINNEYSENDSLRNELLKKDENGSLSSRILNDLNPNTNKFIEKPKDSLVKVLSNFYPKINENKKTLYLTQKYNDILNHFLKDKHTKLGENGITTPAKSKKESKRKKKFLENYIKIWYGHWGGYWQLYSYPKVYSVTFDSNMKYARVNFRMVYEGGEAILINNNGKWELLSAERTWIE